MDRDLEKELDDLKAMRLAEKFGTVSLFVLHKKPSLLQRIRRRLECGING